MQDSLARSDSPRAGWSSSTGFHDELCPSIDLRDEAPDAPGPVVPLLDSMGLPQIGLRWFQRAVAVQLGRSARVAAFADPQALPGRPADHAFV